MKTYEEIEQLKKEWLAAPDWDLAEAEGFEAHRVELEAFEKEWREERDKEYQENLKRESDALGVSVEVYKIIQAKEWRAEQCAERAKRVLKNYFNVVGLDLSDSDYQAELDGLVDDIIEGARAACIVDLLKGEHEKKKV